MSTDETKQAPERQPLQFDTAEPVGGPGAGAAPTSVACTACGADIPTSYYEVNGAIVCLSCRAKLRAQFTGGSGIARFAKAAGLGLLAAAAGSALYYAILALTGYEIGLVAIVVGFLVGSAVNRGSQRRGGPAYQALAVGLTYFAIVTTYIPFIVKEIKKNPPAVAARSAAPRSTAPDTSTTTTTAASEPTAASPTTEPQGAPSTAGAAAATPPAPKVVKITALQALLGLGALLVLAAAMPVLAGVQNIIGMLIIGFALFEAWRLNKRVTLNVSGPYRVGARDGGAALGTRDSGSRGPTGG